MTAERPKWHRASHNSAPGDVTCTCVACLISDHLTLADGLAMRFRWRGEPSEDLTQVARLGLVLAAHRYEPSTGTPFGGYAAPTILGELKRHMRDHAWTVRPPRTLQELRPQCLATVEVLTQQFKRQPLVSEIAAAMDVAPELVSEVVLLDSAYQPDSLDQPAPGADGPALELLAPQKRLEHAEARMAVGPSLSLLPEGDREVVRLHFKENLSQRQIAAVLGISQMQVSRIFRRSLALMRRDIVEIA